MTDDKRDPCPATAAEIEETLSFALRHAGKKRVYTACDVMARVTAERLCSTSNALDIFLCATRPRQLDPPAAIGIRTATELDGWSSQLGSCRHAAPACDRTKYAPSEVLCDLPA